MDPTVELVRAADDATSELRLFFAADPAAPVAWCMPAMGVPAKFYDPLGRALARGGIHAAIGELRGQGSSSVRPSRRVDFGYFDLLSRDWPAIHEALRARWPKNPLFLLGHSLGGHLHSLWAGWHPELADGLILVASGSVDFRAWPPARRPFILAMTQLASAIARVNGHFPGNRFGFGGREARRLIADWARLSRTGKFLPTGATLDFEAAIAQARLPLLAVNLDGDTLTPPGSTDRLVRKFAAAEVTRLTLKPPRTGDRWHFQWARRPELVMPPIASWVTRICMTRMLAPPRAAAS